MTESPYRSPLDGINRKQNNRPFGITVLSIWIISISTFMLLYAAANILGFNNTRNINYNPELGMLVLYLTAPIGNIFLVMNGFLAIFVASGNIVIGFFTLQGSSRAYFVSRLSLVVGIIITLYSWYLIFSLYAIPLNIVWLVYLRTANVKGYFKKIM
jgi:hypothetical protein